MNRLRRRRTKGNKKPMPPWLRLGRIALVVVIPIVGISLILATIAALFNRPAPPPQANPEPEPTVQTIAFKQEITPLATTLKGLVTKPELNLHVVVYEPDQGSFVDINGNTPIPAASLIKVPLLVAFLEQLDLQTIALDEMLQLTEDVKAPEAGVLQDQLIGAKVSALEVATLMITESDNTATNMMIKRLGGIDPINDRLSKWGMSQTRFRNILPDLQGTNTTTAKELVELFSKVEQNQLLSLRSRDLFMDILSQTKNDTLIASTIGETARIRHKTGTIATLIGDSAMVDTPNGKRYFLTVMVRRPPDDSSGAELVRKVSEAVYNHFQANKPLPPTSLGDGMLN